MISPNNCKIKACRICGNKNLIQIGSLGDIAISDFTDTPQEGIKYPLTLMYCERCTLLQLLHNTPRDLLYKNYWYESSINPIIVKDLQEIGKLCKGTHIDIGANDGTLLQNSKAYFKIAVDPSNIPPQGCNEWHRTYWENAIVDEMADTITAIACLYDLPNPNEFIKLVKEQLNPNGIFIAQLMTLQPMIENNDVGNICHEHLEYYSYKSLVYLFEQNGLEIFKVEKNNINGGSYRIFARHYKNGSIYCPEKEYGIKELKDFMKKIKKNKKDFLKWWKSQNYYELFGYSASTKANSILQYYGINNINLIDINKNKISKYAITQQFPITNKIPEDTEYLWVFPYGFIDYFKKKEKRYKGKWVTTIPKFKIL